VGAPLLRELAATLRTALDTIDELDAPMGDCPEASPPERDSQPASPAVANDNAPEAPADRSDLVTAAPPSGNGTDATNDRSTEASAGLPSSLMPKASNPNLLVDDQAVAAWTRLSREEGRPPTITRVAREIGRNRQYLYDCPTFMTLVEQEKVERGKRRDRIARGYKGSFREVEAHLPDD
jgi:hypothetical protein